MRTTKREEDAKQDEYLDFVIGGPEGFNKKASLNNKTNKTSPKKLTKKTTSVPTSNPAIALAVKNP
jgi:hypothetical protein